jgi:hypothetical protein
MNLLLVLLFPGSLILANSVALMVYGKHAFLTRYDASYSKIA